MILGYKHLGAVYHYACLLPFERVTAQRLSHMETQPGQRCNDCGKRLTSEAKK